MKAFRITGHHRITGQRTVAQVAAINWEEAMQLMAITHRRLTCLDKRGVEIVRG